MLNSFHLSPHIASLCAPDRSSGSATELAAKRDVGSDPTAVPATDSPRLGRKSVLMGMLASGFVIANASQSSATPAAVGPLSLAATSAADLTFAVSPRGNDANDGLSMLSAKATIPGALSAANGLSCVILLAAGTHTMPVGVALSSSTVIRGAGTALTTVRYTGAGAAFTSARPGARTYAWRLCDFTLTGPGKSAVGTVGVDLDSVSSAHLHDMTVTGFERGVRIRSVVNGGAVYNRLTNTTMMMCGTGLSIEASGSNATTLDRCRICGCNTGVMILDSNDTTLHACQIEVNIVGVRIEATSPGYADANTMHACRFENNTTAWETTAYVQDTVCAWPHVFGSYVVNDLGKRTNHWGGTTQQSQKMSSALQSASGSWRFERSANGGAQTPAMVLVDSNTSAGVPVTCQIETERASGFFLRGMRGRASYFDVSALDGSIRLPKGGNVELGARTTDAPAPTTAGVRLFAKKVGNKTALCARFPTGAVVQLAIQA